MLSLNRVVKFHPRRWWSSVVSALVHYVAFWVVGDETGESKRHRCGIRSTHQPRVQPDVGVDADFQQGRLRLNWPSAWYGGEKSSLRECPVWQVDARGQCWAATRAALLDSTCAS